MTSNAALFRRYERSQVQLATWAAPDTPVVEYALPPIDLTKLLGDTARAQLQRAQLRKEWHS